MLAGLRHFSCAGVAGKANRMNMRSFAQWVQVWVWQRWHCETGTQAHTLIELASLMHLSPIMGRDSVR